MQVERSPTDFWIDSAELLKLAKPVWIWIAIMFGSTVTPLRVLFVMFAVALFTKLSRWEGKPASSWVRMLYVEEQFPSRKLLGQCGLLISFSALCDLFKMDLNKFISLEEVRRKSYSRSAMLGYVELIVCILANVWSHEVNSLFKLRTMLSMLVV